MDKVVKNIDEDNNSVAEEGAKTFGERILEHIGAVCSISALVVAFVSCVAFIGFDNMLGILLSAGFGTFTCLACVMYVITVLVFFFFVEHEIRRGERFHENSTLVALTVLMLIAVVLVIAYNFGISYTEEELAEVHAGAAAGVLGSVITSAVVTDSERYLKRKCS